MTRIFIDAQPFMLDSSQLIQSGGEGMVFALHKHAIKIYHQPSPAHLHKLSDWINSDFGSILPPNLMGPDRLVFNRHHQLIGFQMPLLPAKSLPIKKLASPIFWKQHETRVANVIKVFQEIHAVLSQLHKHGIVVGDLNDTNLFFLPHRDGRQHPTFRTYWIDVDSYQFGVHQCLVAKEAFLDPQLLGARDGIMKAQFTMNTDWYAYFSLLIKSLLQVHPFGGIHHQYKTIQARAQAGISLLSPDITYPHKARPRHSLSDELLHLIHMVYEQGKRMPFPIQLLEQYADSLIECQQCRLSYPAQRSKCPLCRRLSPASLLPQPTARWQKRLLLEADGFITHIAMLRSGQIVAIVKQDARFKLCRVSKSGHVEASALFAGRKNYRFGLFEQPDGDHYLVVSPPNSCQLLVMDVSRSLPEQISMLATVDFRGEAVYATTPRYLYRIAGNWIMRGGFQDGHYVEEPIVTAHRQQTQIWGSQFDDIIAGYHRVFAEHHFFLIDTDGRSHPISLPPQAPGESISETSLAFSKETIAVFLLIAHKGRERIDSWICDLRGNVLHHYTETVTLSDGLSQLADCYPYAGLPSHPCPPFDPLPAADDVRLSGRCRQHPDGLLLQHPDRLYLISRATNT